MNILPNSLRFDKLVKVAIAVISIILIVSIVGYIVIANLAKLNVPELPNTDRDNTIDKENNMTLIKTKERIHLKGTL